jgi:plastocyanin
MRRLVGSLSLLGLTAALTMVPGGAAVAGGGCHSSPTEGEGDTVEVAKMCFTPSILRVEPGTEVTFVSFDPMSHNISANAWGTDKDMYAGDVFTTKFQAEGIYPYACMYHFGMTGAIVVGDGKGAATVPVDVGTVEDALAQLPSTEDVIPEAEVPAAELPADPTAATSESKGVAGWAVPGALGMLVGGGTAAAVRRRRHEED